jgi:hypothetical protein
VAGASMSSALAWAQPDTELFGWVQKADPLVIPIDEQPIVFDPTEQALNGFRNAHPRNEGPFDLVTECSHATLTSSCPQTKVGGRLTPVRHCVLHKGAGTLVSSCSLLTNVAKSRDVMAFRTYLVDS